MRIGVFGGTFDPPHTGHLIAAQDACVALALDKLLFVPAAVPPHKLANRVTESATRLALVRAAIGDDVRFEACDLELRRTGPSYTVDTLRELAELFPGDQLFLLLGVDQIRDFASWREPSEIGRLAKIVMLTRGGVNELADAPVELHAVVPVTRVDISASTIRQRVAAGLPIRYLVPHRVVELIETDGLYLEGALSDRRSAGGGTTTLRP